MPDWTKSMQQTYEFYIVDPATWGNKTELNQIISCNISWDSANETLGNAKFESTELLEECYVRIYLKTIQNGITERFPLGTFLVQTPESSFDGRVQKISMEAYTPLLELKDASPPYGFTIMTGSPIMETVSDLVAENTRAPVVRFTNSDTVSSNFVSDFESDTWLKFLSDLIASCGYKFALDDMSRVMFAPIQDPMAMQPVWTYDDGNSSILYPEISLSRDLYGIPNVVEVLYSSDTGYRLGRAENRDDSSPISIPRRGREVVHRESDPENLVNPTQAQINSYAEELLRQLSTLEYTVSYSHGYCPVRVGDCVMLNYKRAGIMGVKALVKSQSITCKPGCEVSETATYSTKLWG